MFPALSLRAAPPPSLPVYASNNVVPIAKGNDSLLTDARPIAHGGEPPYDGDMETRVAILEAKIDQLATKDELRAATAELRTDIHRVESTFVKWGVGFAIAIVGAIIGYLNLTKTAAPAAPQPIVIQVPAPAALPPAPSK